MKPFPLHFFTLFALFTVMSQAADPANNAELLPAPPMQGKPWTPPATKLPPIVVDATRKLFDQGMADPRGCEYREVEIASAVPSDEKAATKVHAWVLPADGKTRFCVAWNGLEYPVTAIGAPADIHADIPSGPPDVRKCFSTRWCEYDYNTISEASTLPVKVALLLRIGEPGLAGQVWHDGWQKWTGSWVTDEDGAKSDPYTAMAQDWLDAWYRRALAAHSEGNDAVALQLFRSLQPVVKIVKETATARGAPATMPYGDSTLSYLGELRQLPDLIADQERRAKEPPYTPVLVSGTPASGPAFIAALIRDLELVHGVEWVSPGDNNPINDPIVQALIHQGEPAVEPLIACLEEDPPRMTRTIYSYRERFQGPVEHVYEPAYIALSSILKTDIPVRVSKDADTHELSLDDRKALAAKFRAYWSKNKNIPLPERWFSTLKDDNAPPGQWFQAVANIVQKTDSVTFGADPFTGGGGGYGIPAPDARFRGESLRTKSNPSVSDLLVKRFEQLLPLAKVDSPGAFVNPASPEAEQHVDYDDISKLLLALADWDGKARIADLKRLTQELNAKFPQTSESFTSSNGVNVKLYEKRAALGDPTALKEYTDWLLTLSPKTAYATEVLPMMSSYPNDPGIRKASEKIFLDKDSPWRPSSPAALRQFKDLLNTRMLGLPAFREELRAILDDTTVMGFTRVLADGTLNVQMNDERDYLQKETAALPKVDFRVCDYYAGALQDVWEFPQFQLTWPQARRDAAIAGCKRLLKQYGNDYQRSASSPPEGGWPFVQISLPKLDHPATAEDVAQGRAIFSLTGETRLCPMPKFPLYANRPGSKQEPRKGVSIDASGKQTSVITYTTNGTVWQAEEVKVNGKWQRYYGFAGRHQLEKVPASEIEFPGGLDQWPITPQINGMIELQPREGRSQMFLISSVVAGPDTPLPVVVKAYNHTGLDQEIPAAFLLPPNAGKTLPPAISISLAYSEKIPPDNGETEFDFLSTPVEFDYGKWKEVPLRKEIAPAAGAAPAAPLGPAAERVLAQFDLRDYFDVSKPGTYRLHAVFHPPGRPAVASPEITFTVAGKTN